MFCSNCGGRIADNMKFCGSCGTPIGGKASVATTAPPPAPTYAPTRATPAKPPINRLLFVIPVAVVAVVLVGFLLNGNSNSHGLEGVWRGSYWGVSRELEFRGNTIRHTFLEPSRFGSGSQEGTFSISDGDRIEILWDNGEHQVARFTITENALGPDALRIGVFGDFERIN
ncbi:MAG: zinc ribbon domain-containing protein [Defluviitaleaceae bacterium]|nr:zinc ribbon domain-containing protein [Defluviitaleaceae bacterium]